MQEVLDRHNLYRCMHDVPAMVWSDAIAANAQSWATETGGDMRHSSSNSREGIDGHWMLGENLAKGITDAGAVDMFYDEIKSTPGGNGKVTAFSGSTGHYTQVVWKDSTSLGCAVNGDLLVCQYGPSGNVQGQFEEQVTSPVRSRAECEGFSPSTSPPETTPPATTPSMTTPLATEPPATTPPATTPSATPPSATTPSATTARPKATTTSGDCQDSDSFRDAKFDGGCQRWHMWRLLGYRCSDYPKIADALAENCPIACGYGCGGTPPPTTTLALPSTTQSTAPTVPVATTTPMATEEPTPATTLPVRPSECHDDPTYRDRVFRATCSRWTIWVKRFNFNCEAYRLIRDELPSRCPEACGTCEKYGGPGGIPGLIRSFLPEPAGDRLKNFTDNVGDKIWERTPFKDQMNCYDDSDFKDARWQGTCSDWAGWVADGYVCEHYTDIKDALEDKCPRACGICP